MVEESFALKSKWLHNSLASKPKCLKKSLALKPKCLTKSFSWKTKTQVFNFILIREHFPNQSVCVGGRGLRNDRVNPRKSVHRNTLKHRKTGGQIQGWTSVDPPMSFIWMKSFQQGILKYQETLQLGILFKMTSL